MIEPQQSRELFKLNSGRAELRRDNLFDKQAGMYARCRDGYSQDLFDNIVKHVKGSELCWDVATGNGQAAIWLAKYFSKVVATDSSASQLEHAFKVDKVEYAVRPAVDSGLESCTVDLVSVGKAIHWFYNQQFFNEVDRVLKPGGVLAVFSHLKCSITEEIDDLVRNYFEAQILKPYIAAELKLLNEGYIDIKMPYQEQKRFFAEPKVVSKTAEEYLDNLRTWSAVQTYKDVNGTDPVNIIAGKLKALWGQQQRDIKYPTVCLISIKPHE